MTFLSLALGQLFYTFVAQRRDIADLRIDRLFRNRALDGAVLASIGLTLLPIALPGLGRILGIARLGRYDLAISVLSALAPACIVLARRGLSFDLEQIERGG
jgi:hypothetical protein